MKAIFREENSLEMVFLITKMGINMKDPSKMEATMV